MRYLALLRGINVGGKTKVAMGELRDVMESIGFTNVSTYINSGNVIFESSTQPKASDIEAALEARFNLHIPTIVLSGEKVIAIANAIPDDWTNDSPKPDKSGYKSDVLYLFDDINDTGVLKKIGYKSDLETMIYVDGAVLATVSRKNQTRYSILKIVGTPLYKRMTIRNITTAKKLAELIK